jgi:hypothetical protein
MNLTEFLVRWRKEIDSNHILDKHQLVVDMYKTLLTCMEDQLSMEARIAVLESENVKLMNMIDELELKQRKQGGKR